MEPRIPADNIFGIAYPVTAEISTKNTALTPPDISSKFPAGIFTYNLPSDSR